MVENDRGTFCVSFPLIASSPCPRSIASSKTQGTLSCYVLQKCFSKLWDLFNSSPGDGVVLLKVHGRDTDQRFPDAHINFHLSGRHDIGVHPSKRLPASKLQKRRNIWNTHQFYFDRKKTAPLFPTLHLWLRCIKERFPHSIAAFAWPQLVKLKIT